MTDRFNALVVVLEKDIREDDAQALMDAINLMRGVLDVRGNVVDITCFTEKARLKHELWGKIHECFWEEDK